MGRYPICIEYPHNAVLLICSFSGKAYMCNSPVQFNCLARYHATSATKEMISCPLCRGHVTWEHIVERGHQYMDLKVRGCKQETCGFSGTCKELARHWWVTHDTANMAPTHDHKLQNLTGTDTDHVPSTAATSANGVEAVPMECWFRMNPRMSTRGHLRGRQLAIRSAPD